MEKQYIIGESELRMLLDYKEKLETLEANGVDNWVGYDCTCYDGCWFCKDEDEEIDLSYYKEVK